MLLPMNKMIPFLLRWIYTLGLAILMPAILLRLWIKGYKNPGYRAHWRERLGFFKPPKQTDGLWIQAVSVGESLAAITLIRAIQKRFPGVSITITSTTPTGYAQIAHSFKDQDDICHVYFPYDLPGYIKRFLNRVRPRLLVLMETELWPNCLWLCKQQLLPVMVVNGCISLQSLKGYQRIRPLTRQMLDCLTAVVAQSEQDGARFVQLGLDPKRLVVTGNIKFDMILKKGIVKAALNLRTEWGSTRPVWIAASTHAGEEEQILAAFKKVQTQFTDLLLILVPRHPERFKPVAELIKQQGYSVSLRSSGRPATAETQIFLVDTMGELALFYGASDIAFVGGSLVSIGGHNALEPAAIGIPVIVGPYTHHCMEITRLLREAGALWQIENAAALPGAVCEWLLKPQARKTAGEAGKRVVEENRGVVNTIMDLIGQRFIFR